VNTPFAPETNGQAARRLQESAGIEEVDEFIFELPSGLKVKVASEDDAFLNEPHQEGTKISLSVSAEASAPVKMRGDYWLVHQNDPDDNWPSDFHAHNKVRHETLDCYTGNIYDPRTKQLRRKYRPKQLAALLAALPRRVRP
jgi:hypothetical protein